MWPDWVSNPGSLALKSDVVPTALCGPAQQEAEIFLIIMVLHYT